MFKCLNLKLIKTTSLILLPFFILTFVLSSFISLNNNIDEISTFKEVKIGNQVWMVQNLNIDTFNNGELIPEAKSDIEWLNASEKKQAAWCYAEYDNKNGAKFGKLYNWYAISDSRGFAPKNWHVPNNDEWKQLVDFLGIDAATTMKWGQGWFNERNGTNLSGFSGLPGGYVDDFLGIPILSGISGNWWSTTELDSNSASSIALMYVGQIPIDVKYRKGYGLSVRCIKN